MDVVDFKDQEGTPLQMLDIVIYAEDRGLNLTKAVVLGFIDSGWIRYAKLFALESIDSTIRRKPHDFSWSHKVDNVWDLSDILSKKRPGNLLKIGRWQPTKDLVEQIQCPELVDIILAALP